ncbi:NACHT domain-containing protein [Favolaschia claudopus]|uniref:NACHT domain-containing protein n=1 Tax=Favolaschia claudopus TaxID=2862362 RepID=A0AAV9YZT7_9AGAR
MSTEFITGSNIYNVNPEKSTIAAGMFALNAAAANEASYDSGESYARPPCHPETRKEYLSYLDRWSSSPDSTILWMHGPAGTGKSSIAQSLCLKLAQNQQLGGSFFFRRGHASRANAMKVFPTIAYHLACVSNEIKLAICSSIAEDPAIFTKSLSVQLDKLILQPYQDVALTRPLVIVIDGLDECGDENRQQEILRAIGHAFTLGKRKSHICILIASRPEVHIQREFDEPCLHALHLGIRGSGSDVRTFLVDEFCRIRETHERMENVLAPWPEQEVVDHLVCKSSGHFVYVATVIRFIEDQDWSPFLRLNTVMGMRDPHSKSPFAALDQLYIQILSAVPDQTKLLQLLAVVAAGDSLAKKPLTLRVLSQLLHEDPADTRLILRRLHSVISVPPRHPETKLATAIVVHHASFLDFLNDSTRADKFYFTIAARNCLALQVIKAFCCLPENGIIDPLKNIT